MTRTSRGGEDLAQSPTDTGEHMSFEEATARYPARAVETLAVIVGLDTS